MDVDQSGKTERLLETADLTGLLSPRHVRHGVHDRFGRGGGSTPPHQGSVRYPSRGRPGLHVLVALDRSYVLHEQLKEQACDVAVADGEAERLLGLGLQADIAREFPFACRGLREFAAGFRFTSLLDVEYSAAWPSSPR
ncbi:hypothetical protein [Streptomyces sp. NBC_00391]|uniref:hypothetical protein n=1 Tax=Streptomyces sp. NBC_00391 TaxID=2903647 RepID=UPI002E1F7207